MPVIRAVMTGICSKMEEMIMMNQFELAHVGINNENEEEAQALVNLLCDLLNLKPRMSGKSIFADPCFECMKMPFLGTKGHVGMRTDDLTAAAEELKAKGYELNMDTAAYNEEGKLKNVYLAGEFGGFAIHIMQK